MIRISIVLLENQTSCFSQVFRIIDMSDLYTTSVSTCFIDHLALFYVVHNKGSHLTALSI